MVTATAASSELDQARELLSPSASAAVIKMLDLEPISTMLRRIEELETPTYEKLVMRIINETGYSTWRVGSFMRWLGRRARATRYTGVRTHLLPMLQMCLYHPLLDHIMPDDRVAIDGTLHAQLQAYFSQKEGRPVTFRHTKVQADFGWRTTLACALHASSLTTTLVANGLKPSQRGQA